MRGLPDSFGALRERPFRLLWLGQGMSAVGDAMTYVALTFAVLGTNGSATDLGIVLGSFTISHAAFILVGGVWSDRLPRRLVMLWRRRRPSRRAGDDGRAPDHRQR